MIHLLTFDIIICHFHLAFLFYSKFHLNYQSISNNFLCWNLKFTISTHTYTRTDMKLNDNPNMQRRSGKLIGTEKKKTTIMHTV